MSFLSAIDLFSTASDLLSIRGLQRDIECALQVRNPISTPTDTPALTAQKSADTASKVDALFTTLTGPRSWFERSLASQFTDLNPKELDKLLKKTCACDPKVIEECLGYVNHDALLAALNETLGKIYSNEELRGAFRERIKQFITVLEAVNPNQNRNASYDTSRPGFWDNFLLAFSYFSADHEPDGPWQAVQTLQIYACLVAAPAFLATMLDSTLSDLSLFTGTHKLAYLAAVLAVGLVGFLGLKLYKWYHPIPNFIRPMRNLGVDAIVGGVDPLRCRDDIITRIFSCWQSSDVTSRRHPLLVGEAGVGKSVIIMEVARRIAFEEVPEALRAKFKGKIVFGGTSASLIADAEGGLDRFMRRIEAHKEGVVVAIDEIHSFFNSQNEGVQGEFLKSLLDTGSGGLPYVLGATTKDEYNRFIAHDPARARRFEVIHVAPLTKEQVMLTLQQMVNRRYSEHNIPQPLLEYVYAQTEAQRSEFAKNQQPEVSARVLMSALAQLMMQAQEIPSAKGIQDKKDERLNLCSRYMQEHYAAMDATKALASQLDTIDTEINSLGSAPQNAAAKEELKAKQVERLDVYLPYVKSLVADKARAETFAAQLKAIDAEIAQLEDVAHNESAQIEKYGVTAKKLTECHQEMRSLATKIDDEYHQRRLVFLTFYMIPYLRVSLADVRKKLRIPDLDKAMIDRTIADFIETERHTKAKGTDQAGSTSHLHTQNAVGNDKSLATDGDARTYLYSFIDAEILTRTLRSARLTYKNNGTPFKAPGGEIFSHLRENDQKTFIAPPYHYDNFMKSFRGDIATITGAHVNETKNNTWSALPQLLVISFLKGAHWYVVRIEIDYAARSASILWDDPMGRSHFDQQIKEQLAPCIIAGIHRLVGKEGATPTITHAFKEIDQQGVGKNGTDCGPIAMSNLADYLDVNKHNSTFAAQHAEREFSVRRHNASDHEQVMIQLRASHTQQVIAMMTLK